MEVLVATYVAILGLCFGSFALAMVDRMKAGKDWVRGRSSCDNCKHKLAAVDLIPILSWLRSRGRCRYCSVKLSASYPLAELLSGFVFLLSYIFYPFELQGIGIVLFILWSFALILCIGLTIFDLRWFLLPNKLVYPLIGLGLVHRYVHFSINDQLFSMEMFISTVLSLMVGSGLFLALYIISRGKWIGDGDIRLGFAMGLFLPGPVEVWLAIFVASVAGLLFAGLTSRKKNIMKLKIPYGPFLILGLFVSYLFSAGIIEWYTSTLLFY